MSVSSTGTTTDMGGGTGFTFDELTEELSDAHNEIALLTRVLFKIKALGDETPIQFVRRHGIDPSAGGAGFVAAARADVLAILREAGL